MVNASQTSTSEYRGALPLVERQDKGMSTLKELYKKRRELLAEMKTLGVRKTSCMNRVDNTTFHYNRLLAEIQSDIDKAKRLQSEAN